MTYTPRRNIYKGKNTGQTFQHNVSIPTVPPSHGKEMRRCCRNSATDIQVTRVHPRVFLQDFFCNHTAAKQIDPRDMARTKGTSSIARRLAKVRRLMKLLNYLAVFPNHRVMRLDSGPKAHVRWLIKIPSCWKAILREKN